MNFKLCAIAVYELHLHVSPWQPNLSHDHLQKRKEAEQRTSSLKGTLLLSYEMIQHLNDSKISKIVMNYTKPNKLCKIIREEGCLPETCKAMCNTIQ